MSQGKVTNFFTVRKKLPDQHAAKRRKVLTDANPVSRTVSKLDVEEPLKKKVVEDAKDTATDDFTEITTVTDVVTSSTDDHMLAPKTPSSSNNAENKRSSKRASKEAPVTPSNEDGKLEENAVRFTPGSGKHSASSAKKKLDMGAASRARKNVEFTKLGQLSPKKKVVQESEFMKSEEFKVPTPVKELIGARRPRPTRESINKKLFDDDNDVKQPRPKRSMRAEIETATAIAKKLSPEEIKLRLGTRNKSVDFRAKLKNLIEESKKVDQVKKKRELPSKLLTPTKTGIEIQIPQSPSKAQVKSQVKASPRKVPAYQRFAYLTQPVEKELILPFKYRMLAEVFNSVDNVVSIYFNRMEKITYPKLLKAVQDMMRKNFGEKFLKQIKCVFPQAYFYAWQKVLNKFGQKKEEYELSIEPNLNYKNDILKGFGVDDEEKKKGKLSGEMLLERKTIFHNSMLQMVKDQHKNFLATLSPPIIVDDTKLTRWHRDFDVERCSEIDTSELPAKPHVEKMVSAQDVLSKANQIFNLNPKLGESLVEAANRIQQDADNKPGTSSTPAPAQQEPVLKGLKGLNPKLLEKIRAKEAEKAKVEMTRDHTQIKRLRQLEKLSGLARTARGLFIGERKTSLPMTFVLRKMVESYPGQIDNRIMEEDLRFLHLESDGWFRIQAVRTLEYCIINPSKDINSIAEMLDNKHKKEKEA